MTIKLILGLVTVFVWFLWLLAPMGICTQGNHVKSLCREPRFLFAIPEYTALTSSKCEAGGVPERSYSSGWIW